MTSTTGQSRDMNPTRDDFAALLSETLSEDNAFEGSVIKGTITAIEKDLAVIDVGLKMEGRVPLREFALPGKPADLKVGDEVEVYLERMENALIFFLRKPVFGDGFRRDGWGFGDIHGGRTSGGGLIKKPPAGTGGLWGDQAPDQARQLLPPAVMVVELESPFNSSAVAGVPTSLRAAFTLAVPSLYQSTKIRLLSLQR